jgi:hypothetical protein
MPCVRPAFVLVRIESGDWLSRPVLSMVVFVLTRLITTLAADHCIFSLHISPNFPLRLIMRYD